VNFGNIEVFGVTRHFLLRTLHCSDSNRRKWVEKKPRQFAYEPVIFGWELKRGSEGRDAPYHYWLVYASVLRSGASFDRSLFLRCSDPSASALSEIRQSL